MTSVLAFAYGAVALVAAIVLALVFGTTLVLPFAVLPRGRRERYTSWGAAAWCWVVLRCVLLVRPEVTGQAKGGGALYVCNHRSWLDPLLLIATTRAIGLSKSEIFWIPFVGQFAWLAGVVFFDRQSRRQRARAREEVMRLIRAGHRIHVYPEGTRTRTGELRRKVHLVLVRDCWDAGLPVVPCAVHHTERVLPPGTRGAFPLQRVRLDIGEPMDPAAHPSAAAFAEAVWDEVKRRAEPSPGPLRRLEDGPQRGP